MCLLRSQAQIDHFLPDLGFRAVLAPPFFSTVLTSLSHTSHTQRPVEKVEQQVHFNTLSPVRDFHWPPLTCRDGVHPHAERVVASVAFVAEHHLVLMVGLLAHGAGLTLHALPVVRLDHTNQLAAHVQTGRVA